MHASTLIKDELNPNEKILWQGQPQQGIMLKASDIFLVPFSLLWGGFAFFWEYSVLQSDAPIFMKLWGIPFVLVGLYITVGRFFFDSYIRGKTWYAVTNERILIINDGFNKKVKNINLKTLTEIELRPQRENRGTIIFGAMNPFESFRFFSASGMQGNSTPRFEGIENAKQVYQLIQQQQVK